MVGYIYLTKNLINGRMYIGKHHSAIYDSNYYGSGKILQQAIERYGKENFTNEILFEANTVEELNLKEIQFISEYRKKYKEKMYNIANGGDGGDTFSHQPEEFKKDFISKMTLINKERCNTEEFKTKLSKATSERYKDPKERDKQSQKIKKSWSDEKLRQEQSERLKEYYKTHKKDMSYLQKPCCFELNDIKKEFVSVKELKKFLKENYNYKPKNTILKRTLEEGSKGIKFNPIHKNKHKNIIGMLIYYK